MSWSKREHELLKSINIKKLEFYMYRLSSHQGPGDISFITQRTRDKI